MTTLRLKVGDMFRADDSLYLDDRGLNGSLIRQEGEGYKPKEGRSLASVFGAQALFIIVEDCGALADMPDMAETEDTVTHLYRLCVVKQLDSPGPTTLESLLVGFNINASLGMLARDERSSPRGTVHTLKLVNR